MIKKQCGQGSQEALRRLEGIYNEGSRWTSQRRCCLNGMQEVLQVLHYGYSARVENTGWCWVWRAKQRSCKRALPLSWDQHPPTERFKEGGWHKLFSFLKAHTGCMLGTCWKVDQGWAFMTFIVTKSCIAFCVHRIEWN